MEALGTTLASLIFTGGMMVLAVLSMRSRAPQDTLTLLNTRITVLTGELTESREELIRLKETIADLRDQNSILARRIVRLEDASNRRSR